MEIISLNDNVILSFASVPHGGKSFRDYRVLQEASKIDIIRYIDKPFVFIIAAKLQHFLQTSTENVIVYDNDTDKRLNGNMEIKRTQA